MLGLGLDVFNKFDRMSKITDEWTPPRRPSSWICFAGRYNLIH